MMRKFKTLLPRGLKDISPSEAEEVKKIKDKLLSCFSSWGYFQVETPAFEFYEILASQTGELIQKEMFKLFDSDGELLALKPEMTTPLARMACQKYSKSPLPLRFSYISDVFRQEPPKRGQLRQFIQAGVELIGETGNLADAEVLCLSIEVLLKLGLKNFTVSVGQMDIIDGILEKLNSPDAKLMKDALLNKNIALLKQVESNITGPKKILKVLDMALRCNDIKSLKELEKLDLPAKAKKAITSLLKTLSLVDKCGFKEYVSPDLALLSNFEYYTGMVFEIYASTVGFPIGSGGRYDNLLIKFGKNMPAAGFAFGLERLHIALNDSKISFKDKAKKVVIFGDPGSALFLKAAELRESGYKTSILSDVNAREASLYANEYGFLSIAELKNGVLYSVGLDGKRTGRWS
jgi:ATP phosphoribosyltransferase regulatory subunit